MHKQMFLILGQNLLSAKLLSHKNMRSAQYFNMEQWKINPPHKPFSFSAKKTLQEHILGDLQYLGATSM